MVANEGQVNNPMVGRWEEAENHSLMLYSELTRVMKEQQAAHLEIKDSDPNNLTQTVRKRILGPSTSAVATGSTLRGGTWYKDECWSEGNG